MATAFLRRRFVVFLAGAFLAVDLRRRRFAGAFLAAAFLRRRVFLTGAAFLAVDLRRRRVVLRAAGFLAVVFFAVRRFAGLRAVVFLAALRVRLLAGGTITYPSLTVYGSEADRLGLGLSCSPSS